ncbi:hypothetical protein BRC68_00115 [Halobacteriales archaeon QH_6_64_20]|nr:MAG: hypothetical protein BRC68_00115 [Halobacteriales archaeon QH_6_64_20]
MTTSAATTDSRGFFEFYREYAQTGIHAATAAALTGFIGLASFISPWFLAVAIAVYALPPIYFYLNDVDPTPETESPSPEAGSNPDASPEDDSTWELDSETPDAGSADGAGSPAAGDSAPTPVSDRSESDGRAVAATSGEGDTDDTSTRSDADDAEADPGAARVDHAGVDTEADAEADVDADEEVDSDADTDTESGAGAGTGTDATVDLEPDWAEVDSPVDVALYDTVASADAVYAAGDDGVVLARRAEWEVPLDDGPAADSNPLRGIDYTDGDDDEEVLWIAGDSGAVGRYDPAAGGVTDFSAPKDQTSTWTDVAVAGPAGEENVHLTNGSGAVLRGTYDGADGSIEWGEIGKPGSGSSITAITFRDREVGYLCDSSGGVFETGNGGESYAAIDGVDAGTAFSDLAPVGDNGLLVAGEDGSLFRYDGSAWTRRSLSDTSLHTIDTTEGESADLRAVAGDGSGTVHERIGDEWDAIETTAESVRAVAVEGIGVAIGDDGAIYERERTRPS